MSSSSSTQPAPAAHATLTLEGNDLKLRCPNASNLRDDRTLTAADEKTFQNWSARHLKLAHNHNPAALLKLGQEMGAWLEGASSSLTTIVKAGNAPTILAFIIEKDDESPLARAFLDAPWELLALPGKPQHLALKQDVVLTVIRRVGAERDLVPAASPHRLNTVFMAAAPRKADNLSWEAEETAILTATQHMPLDLVVEESGTLELLGNCVAREKPDVVQISCHGTLEPKPGLYLEDDVGDIDLVSADRLIQKLAAHHPRLLFLSACETAETHSKLDSLAQSLVRSGAQSVLGWAASVYDNEATLFGSHLLEKLAQGRELAETFAYTRLEMAEHEQLQETTDGSPRARHWHLARLYLSPTGGGSLATADGPHRLQGQGQAARTFLDVKGGQVPVASDLEFVGRRREVQGILSEFRAPTAQRHAGVLIHGMGRQGKSSLAARVARRMEHSHEVVVLFGRYDAVAVLAALRERLGTEDVGRIVKEYLPRVEQDPAQLQTALNTLLEGPFRQADPAKQHRPVLLIVDDFERALEAHTTGTHTVRADLVASIRSIIAAFKNADTQSHLLFTSRFEFTLPNDAQGGELADHLHPVPLRGMNDREAQKQALAKLRQKATLTHHKKNLPELNSRLPAIMAAAQGNPGLQELLFSLCLESPATCDKCLQKLATYRKSGPAADDADDDKLRRFLEDLAIKTLLDLLDAPTRQLLRASTLFQVPVPVAVMEALAESSTIGADTHAIGRLVALGLWEAYEDLHDHRERAFAINALVCPLVDDLSEEDQHQHAATVSVPLFRCWAEKDKKEHLRRGALNLELTRLALLAHEPRVLAGAADALRALEKQFAYKAAAVWARQVMALFPTDLKVQPTVDLLRTAADAVQRVGEVERACEWRGRAFELVQKGAAASDFDRGSLALAHARSLVELGRIDEALASFEEARQFAGTPHDRAVVLGDLARIHAAKGEVDAAMALHEEAMAVYEDLSNKRSCAAKGKVDEKRLGIFEALGEKIARAVTLGDIARIRAAKGEVDAALALHEKKLKIVKDLGDKRSCAVTLGDIARIRATKGEVDAALALHEEQMEVYEALGDKRSRAVTLGDIARIRANKGEVDAALALHEERLAIFEALGDLGEKAQTLWSMAQIEMQRRQWQAAFEHLSESHSILLQTGRLDGICAVGLDLGQLLCAAGQREQGREILERSLAGFQKLGWQREIQHTEGVLARLFGGGAEG